jgi:hypothetical protein
MANEGRGATGGGGVAAAADENIISRGWHYLFGRSGGDQGTGGPIDLAATGKTLADAGVGGGGGGQTQTALLAAAQPVYVVNWPTSLGGTGTGAGTTAGNATGGPATGDTKALADRMAQDGGQAIADKTGIPPGNITANGQPLGGGYVGANGMPVKAMPANTATGGGGGYNIYDASGSLSGWTDDPNKALQPGYTMKPATGGGGGGGTTPSWAAGNTWQDAPTTGSAVAQPLMFGDGSGGGSGDGGGGDSGTWDTSGGGSAASSADTSTVDAGTWDTGGGAGARNISLGGGPRVSGSYGGTELDAGIYGLGQLGRAIPAIGGASVGIGSTGANINVFSGLMNVLKAGAQQGKSDAAHGGGGFAIGGGGGGDNTASGGLLSDIFSHAGGFTGWATDKLLGQGMYERGGLFGMLTRGSGGGGSGDATGGEGGAWDTGAGGGGPGSDSFGYTGGLGDGGAWDTGGFGDAGLSAGEDLGGFYATGGVIGGGGLSGLRNSVVSAPTVFRFAAGGRTGMAGEAGAEAILPLKRDGSGRLGVSADAFGGGAAGDTHVHTWNIQTPDANSFMRSRNQIEASMTLSMGKARARNNQ